MNDIAKMTQKPSWETWVVCATNVPLLTNVTWIQIPGSVCEYCLGKHWFFSSKRIKHQPYLHTYQEQLPDRRSAQHLCGKPTLHSQVNSKKYQPKRTANIVSSSLQIISYSATKLVQFAILPKLSSSKLPIGISGFAATSQKYNLSYWLINFDWQQ